MARDRAPSVGHFSIPHPDRRPANQSPSDRNAPVDDGVTATLRITLEAKRPVHVGSGAVAIHDGAVVRDVVRAGDAPVIPGSTLKGAVRLVHEAFTQSDNPDFERVRPPLRYPPPGAKPERDPVSTSSRLFGALGYLGRVAFEEARAPGDTALEVVSLSAPHAPTRPAGRRFYGPLPSGVDRTAAIGALAIPAGTTLETRLHVDQVTRAELGGVIRAMGIGPDGATTFPLRVGGGRYDGFGAVQFTVTGVRIRDLATAAHRTPIGDVGDFVAECLAAFRPTAQGGTLLRQLADRLREGAE